MILSDFRIVVAFWTAMFWHIRQEKTYFAGKVLNFYQRNLIQNPSWSHNNSQEPWNIKSNILFLSLLYFWCCRFIFNFNGCRLQLTLSLSYREVVMIIYYVWYYVFINQSSDFPDIFLLYLTVLVIGMKQIMQLSKSPTSPPTGFKMPRWNLEGLSIFVHFAALT